MTFVHRASPDNGRSLPFAPPIERSFGNEVQVGGKRAIVVGSNDFLGLTHDPRVLQAASDAVRRWGAGPGGSRFLSGNMTLHEQLEERLADLVGKRRAVVHTTGYLTNYGAINALVTPQDVVVGDRENRGSVMDGCRVANAALLSYDHNNPEDAARMLAKAEAEYPEATVYLVTQSIFGLTGQVATCLPQLAALKKDHPELVLYLDDSYGLGVTGKSGRGTADHFGVSKDVDYIMGTFSKSLASIGGFVAGDDPTIMDYLRHHSKSLIFSAALPAMNAAAVLAGLEILEREPERRERLWEVTRRVRKDLARMGLVVGQDDSPVIPVFVGDEHKADAIVAELLSRGVYLQSVQEPMVPKGRALLRITFMSTHEDGQIDFVLSQLDELAGKYSIRAVDMDVSDPFITIPAQPDASANVRCSAS